MRLQIISRKELEKMLEQQRDFVLIEALPEDEFEQSHLPCAINVPLDDEHFEERVREAVPEPEYDIVVYCDRADSRLAHDAAKRIESLGYVSVYEYRDGKKDWLDAGQETVH